MTYTETQLAMIQLNFFPAVDKQAREDIRANGNRLALKHPRFAKEWNKGLAVAERAANIADEARKGTIWEYSPREQAARETA